jgi:hypothetical protein
MKKINNIILALASLQAGILNNANACDDDLDGTWNQVREDYNNVKTLLDKYLLCEAGNAEGLTNDLFYHGFIDKNYVKHQDVKNIVKRYL